MPSDNSRFVAGHYTATITSGPGTNGSAIDIGSTEVGFNITRDYHLDQIKDDAYGDTIVDGIYRGGNCRITFKSINYAIGGRPALQHWYDTTIGKIEGIGQTIGGTFGRSLVLAPVAGINAGNKTFTFSLVAPDGQHGGMPLASRNRTVDCNLLVFPVISGAGTNQTAILFTEV